MRSSFLISLLFIPILAYFTFRYRDERNAAKTRKELLTIKYIGRIGTITKDTTLLHGGIFNFYFHKGDEVCEFIGPVIGGPIEEDSVLVYSNQEEGWPILKIKKEYINWLLPKTRLNFCPA